MMVAIWAICLFMHWLDLCAITVSFGDTPANRRSVTAGAIEVYGNEWSFGYCPHGSGVYRVLPKSNQMYTYREPVELGTTNISQLQLNTIIQDLQREWAGSSYDLVARNCNHFCGELCARLGCQPLPGKPRPAYMMLHTENPLCLFMLLIFQFG